MWTFPWDKKSDISDLRNEHIYLLDILNSASRIHVLLVIVVSKSALDLLKTE